MNSQDVAEDNRPPRLASRGNPPRPRALRAEPGPDAGLRQDLSPGPFPAREGELGTQAPAPELPSPARGGIEGEVRQDLERGLHFAHIMLMVNQNQGNRAVASVEALVALLASKGVIQPAELAEPLEHARQQLAEAPAPQVRLAEMGDKYADQQAVEIDCESRLPLCRARCCTLRFFLTKQDLDEGVARWDYGNPYWIRQGADGYCSHSDPGTRRCAIWAKRPHTCRLYDCRNDKRIWIDFAQRIPAPLAQPEPPLPVAMAEVALRQTNGTSGSGG